MIITPAKEVKTIIATIPIDADDVLLSPAQASFRLYFEVLYFVIA